MSSVAIVNGDSGTGDANLSSGEAKHSRDCSNLSNSLEPIACLPPEDQLAALIETGLTEAQALESWKLLHSAESLTAPFVQRAEAHDGGSEVYPWVQLSGHQGNFRPGRKPGTVLKVLCQCEVECLRLLSEDPLLKDFAPRFHGCTAEGDKRREFVEMQDLLADFPGCTGILDCKMGSRTYLESELEGDQKPRRDLYEKMIEVDRDAPTPEESSACAVSKPRYMIWREQLSSTTTLSFRVDGFYRLESPLPRDLKRLRERADVAEVLAAFVDRRADLVESYVARLKQLRDALESSEFFAQREIIGSSLLFVHDAAPGHASVWMIDFGKSQVSPVPIDHRSDWLHGNHEDGYLTGLDNLIEMLSSLSG